MGRRTGCRGRGARVWSGPMKEAERRRLVCGMLCGLTHTDTKVKLVECTPVEKGNQGG